MLFHLLLRSWYLPWPIWLNGSLLCALLQPHSQCPLFWACSQHPWPTSCVDYFLPLCANFTVLYTLLSKSLIKRIVFHTLVTLYTSASCDSGTVECQAIFERSLLTSPGAFSLLLTVGSWWIASWDLAQWDLWLWADCSGWWSDDDVWTQGDVHYAREL